MARYFFDTRDNDIFLEDDEGVDLPDLEAVKFQASASLGELARDVLFARLSFEAIVLV
jgi:hypothetical protein